MSKRKLAKFSAVAFGVILILTGLLFWQSSWFFKFLGWYSPDVVYTFDTEAPVVALTIDDGPDSATTPRILDILKQHNAYATFFVIASHIPGNDALIERAIQEGHELGNHLVYDEPAIDLSPAQFEQQLLEADKKLSQFSDIRWFRPGSGWYSEVMVSVALEHNYQTALGSVYPFDPQIPSVTFAANYILSNVQPGSVIILHDHKLRGVRTAEVLETVLPELKQRGYRVVTLSELSDLHPKEGGVNHELR